MSSHALSPSALPRFAAQLTDNPSDTPLTLLPKLKKHSYDDIEKKQNLMRSAGEL